jgi:hypothetical protein
VAIATPGVERHLVSNHDDALSFGIAAADIAWPIVLAMCIALMIVPFVFIILVKRGDHPDGPPA